MVRVRSPQSSAWFQNVPPQTGKWLLSLSVVGLLIWVIQSISFKGPSRSQEVICLTSEQRDSLVMSEKIYNEFLLKREERVKSRPTEIDPWVPYVYPFDYFVATFGCPFSVQRIGAMGDGGKWICGIERFQNAPCVVYSFGISVQTTFEVEILGKTSCEIYAFDASVGEVVGVAAEHKKRVTFSKMYGGAKSSSDVTTLKQAMATNGHTHIDVLKIDIEFTEFVMLEQIIDEFGADLPFSQLLIEIHTVMRDGNEFAKLYNFFVKLEKAGLRPFRNELNLAPIVLTKDHVNSLSEYSFLNIHRICRDYN